MTSGVVAGKLSGTAIGDVSTEESGGTGTVCAFNSVVAVGEDEARRTLETERTVKTIILKTRRIAADRIIFQANGETGFAAVGVLFFMVWL